MSSLKRHFTAVVNSKEHGIYNSSSPSSAARKIVSKLCASSKSKKVEFCVRETTQKSEKKTYGPYLGEMKKLAKPIELKGRVIRYAPEVHLKKKKTATKTGKKIGKKMRGGTITDGGELDDKDFLLENRVYYKNELIDGNYIEGGNADSKYLFIPHNTPKIIDKYKKWSDEPYLFFDIPDYFKIASFIETNNTKTYTEQYKTYKYPIYYSYVAYNRGILKGFKKAIFKHYTYNPDDGTHNIFDVNISNIPIKELEKLRDFLNRRRTYTNQLFVKPKFCNTIYKAVVDITGPP